MGHNIFVQNIPTTQFLIYQHIYLGIADIFNHLQNHAAVKKLQVVCFQGVLHRRMVQTILQVSSPVVKPAFNCYGCQLSRRRKLLHQNGNYVLPAQ